MQERKKIKIIDIIFYVVLLLLILFFLQGRIRSFIKAKNFTGKNITFSNVIDIENNQYDMSTDKLVCLVFWASWCNPCILEIPVLNEIHREMNDKVLILAINSGENRDTIKIVITKHKILYPVVEDINGEFSSFFKIEVIPTIVFIKNKKIIKIKNGYSPLLKNEIHDLIKKYT